jgi:hypothetical protein
MGRAIKTSRISLRKVENGMKTRALICGLALAAFDGLAGDLKHFNPEIFGKDVCTPVQVLLDGGSLQPTTVQLDVKNGLYYGAILRYPAEMTLDQARQSLNKLYAKWQKPNFADDQTMGLWRNTEKGFSIQLTREKDAVVVIYISYKLMHEKP